MKLNLIAALLLTGCQTSAQFQAHYPHSYVFKQHGDWLDIYEHGACVGFARNKHGAATGKQFEKHYNEVKPIE